MIRNTRINPSTKVVPESVIDLGGLEADIKDKLEQVSASKLAAESKISSAKRDLSSGLKDILKLTNDVKNGLPALSPSAIENVLSKILGPSAGAQGAKIIDALLSMPKSVIDKLKAVIKKISCALHNLDITNLVFGLAGYFKISGGNLCNPTDDLAKIMAVTKGILNKNVSSKTLETVAKISGGSESKVVMDVTTVVNNIPTTNQVVQNDTPEVLVPPGVNPNVYDNNPTTVATDAMLGISGGLKIVKTPPKYTGTVIQQTSDFDPSDYTEEELRQITLGTLKPAELDTTYDHRIVTTIPKVESDENGVIEIRQIPVESYSSGTISGSTGSVPDLGGFKPTEAIHLDTLLSIPTILPDEVIDAANTAVGIGIVENFKSTPSTTSMITVLLANKHWVKTYMPHLPNAVISGIKPSKSNTITKAFLEELDNVYPGWHRETTSGAKDIYSGLEEFTDVRDRYLPDLDCLINTNKVTGVQKLIMFGLSKRLPVFVDKYERFLNMD